MNYNVSFDYAAMIIVSLLLCVYLIRPRFNNLSAKLFQVMIVNIFFASATEIFSCQIIENPTKTPMLLNYLVIGMFLYSINICTILYYRYVLEITAFGKIKKYERYIFFFALILDFIIIALSPFTKLTFYFDENNIYRHGPLFYLLYFIAFFMLIMTAVKFFHYRKRVNQIQKFSLLFFYILNIGAIIFERFYTKINILTFVTALFMFLLYVSLQNPEYYVDSELACYNQEAFVKVCEQKILNSHKFAIISFYPDAYEYVNQVFGVDRGMDLVKYIAKYFIDNFRYENFFHITDSHFVYICNYDMEYAEKIYKKIWIDFNKAYEINNAKIALQPRGCAILVPNVVNTSKDILDAIFFSKNKELANTKEELYYLDSEFLHKKHRKERIAQIIKEKIAIKGFEVLYMPIYDMNEKCIVAAEALVRLYDKELGEIHPEEFIVIAEEHGLILELDQAIFEKVCQFIHFMDLRSYKIKSIEINLSTIEIMQGESPDRWLDILRRNKVNPEKINFEIREPVCLSMKKNLIKNMEVLKEKGCTFSLDNYGTGVSNVTELLKLEFDIIKIDKTILWEAMKTEAAMHIFESMVSMFKKLGYEVLVSGIETEEERKVMETLQVDYMQGFIISKPLKDKEFIKLLDKNEI